MVARLLAVGISKSYFLDCSIGLLMRFSIALLRRRVGLHRFIDATTLKNNKDLENDKCSRQSSSFPGSCSVSEVVKHIM